MTDVWTGVCSVSPFLYLLNIQISTYTWQLLRIILLFEYRICLKCMYTTATQPSLSRRPFYMASLKWVSHKAHNLFITDEVSSSVIQTLSNDGCLDTSRKTFRPSWVCIFLAIKGKIAHLCKSLYIWLKITQCSWFFFHFFIFYYCFLSLFN